MRLDTYLLFKGNCEEAFKLYEQVLGGKLELMRFSDMPAGSGGETSPEWRNKVLHVALRNGDALLMGSDAPPQHEHKANDGFSVSVTAASPAEVDRIFNALAKGGEVRMPTQQTFWSPRFGMLVDRFGIPWMVGCEQPA
jgi:PhnB protein